MEKFFILAILVVLVLQDVVAEKDYCNIDDCPPNVTHIGCNFKIPPNSKLCGEHPKIVNLDDYQEQIVSVINSFRNNIALGAVSGFPEATNMTTITWDNEFGYLASLGIMLCSPQDEFCFNTNVFPNVQRNTFELTSLKKIPIDIIISLALSEWYYYGQNVTIDDINSFNPNHVEIEKFILMINDRCTKVGCALLETTFLDSGVNYYKIYFDCLFSCANIPGQPIYTPGTNECKPFNPIFPGLCATDDENNEGDLAANVKENPEVFTYSDMEEAEAGQDNEDDNEDEDEEIESDEEEIEFNRWYNL